VEEHDRVSVEIGCQKVREKRNLSHFA